MTQAFNLSQFANKVNTSGQADLTTAVTGTLPVANGGTGASTLTTNNVLLGNGTSAVQVVAPSTSGNVLTSNGTTWVSQAAGGGGVYQAQIFTTPGTWTKPATATSVKVMVVGGGGGSAPGNGCGGTGGIATAYVSSLSGPVAVTIGTGGNSASPGGTSSFGAFVSATGGSGTVANTPGTGTVTTGTAFATGSVASFNNVTTIAINGTGITANLAGLAYGSMARNLFNNTPGTPYTVTGGYLPGAAGNRQNTQPSPECGGVGGAIIVEFVG